MAQDNNKKNYPEYNFQKKTYLAVPEISKGACVGCAFYNKLDCSKYPERIALCRQGNIFKRKLQHIDD